MSFKDTVKSDIRIFFDDFSETHTIDGEEIDVLIDDNELINRNRKRVAIDEGNYLSKKMIYVKADEFGELPQIDTVVELDGVNYNVTESINEQGIYSITLEAIES